MARTDHGVLHEGHQVPNSRASAPG